MVLHCFKQHSRNITGGHQKYVHMWVLQVTKYLIGDINLFVLHTKFANFGKKQFNLFRNQTFQEVFQ